MRDLRMKPIPGWDGYFISAEGVVYSQWINKGRHGIQKGPLKALQGRKLKSGHRSVQFKRGSKQHFVHRLVYEAFSGPIPQGMMIRHLNDNADDNRIENLAVGTQKDNMRDAKRNGIFPIGSKNGQSKLNEIEVLKIKSLLENKTQTEISRLFGVSRETIGAIKRGKTWKHVN